MAPQDADTPDAPEDDDDDEDKDEDEGIASRGAQPAPAPSRSRGSVAGESQSSAQRPRVFENTSHVSTGTDTGTFPQGGIQAGGGGMADGGEVLPVLLLGSGAIALVLTAGGLRLRRRGLGS